MIWAVRHEMARTVGDVLARRGRALFLNARLAVDMAPQVAAIMAAELGHGDEWERSQVATFTMLAQSYLEGCRDASSGATRASSYRSSLTIP